MVGICMLAQTGFCCQPKWWKHCFCSALNNVVALRWPGTCSVWTNYLLGLAATPSSWTKTQLKNKSRKSHIQGNLLSCQNKCGARNDGSLTHVSAEPHSEKSSWYRDITTGSTGGAKRQHWGEIAVNVHAVNFITYFRSHLLSSVFLPLVCHSMSFSILLTFISIFWWWWILSSSVGCNRFYCFF